MTDATWDNRLYSERLKRIAKLPGLKLIFDGADGKQDIIEEGVLGQVIRAALASLPDGMSLAGDSLRVPVPPEGLKVSNVLAAKLARDDSVAAVWRVSDSAPPTVYVLTARGRLFWLSLHDKWVVQEMEIRD